MKYIISILIILPIFTAYRYLQDTNIFNIPLSTDDDVVNAQLCYTTKKENKVSLGMDPEYFLKDPPPTILVNVFSDIFHKSDIPTHKNSLHVMHLSSGQCEKTLEFSHGVGEFEAAFIHVAIYTWKKAFPITSFMFVVKKNSRAFKAAVPDELGWYNMYVEWKNNQTNIIQDSVVVDEIEFAQQFDVSPFSKNVACAVCGGKMLPFTVPQKTSKTPVSPFSMVEFSVFDKEYVTTSTNCAAWPGDCYRSSNDAFGIYVSDNLENPSVEVTMNRFTLPNATVPQSKNKEFHKFKLNSVPIHKTSDGSNFLNNGNKHFFIPTEEEMLICSDEAVPDREDFPISVKKATEMERDIAYEAWRPILTSQSYTPYVWVAYMDKNYCKSPTGLSKETSPDTTSK